jgi:hypothetical protein
MTIDFQIRIEAMYAKNDGVIERVQWTIVADDGKNQAVRLSDTELNPSDGDITPFEQLTEQEVKDWIITNNPDEIRAIKESLAIELQNYATEAQPHRPPWVPERRKPKLRLVTGKQDRREKSNRQSLKRGINNNETRFNHEN